MPTSLPTATDLTMWFCGFKVVGTLSFKVWVGRITATIGSNGAGKATVFNCITGFYRPTSGSLALNSQDGFALERTQDHRIARVARVACVFLNIRCPAA